MAKDYSSQGYVITEKGDTLWGIAKRFLGAGTRYKELAAINNIENPNVIMIGQKILLTSGGSSSTTSPPPTNSNTVKITAFGLMANSDDVLYAMWTWNRGNTDSYKVLWTYDLGDGIERGSIVTNNIDEDAPELARQSTFTIPKNARKIYFKVKPIAKNKETDSSSPTQNQSNDPSVQNAVKSDHENLNLDESTLSKKYGISIDKIREMLQNP